MGPYRTRGAHLLLARRALLEHRAQERDLLAYLDLLLPARRL